MIRKPWILARIRRRFPRLQDNVFPKGSVEKSSPLEPIFWSPPFASDLVCQPIPGIMIVLAWLSPGDPQLGFIEVLRHFATQGIRVTMVLTRLHYPDGMVLRKEAARYTNDIHFLPGFLRMCDFPRYLKYLMDSRQINTVFLSHSQLIYEILPALAEATPEVDYIDYVSQHQQLRPSQLIPIPGSYTAKEMTPGRPTDLPPSP
jgi:hypothetical protein